MSVQKYSLYRSQPSETVKVKPVLFYHLPKCGGMTIYALASATWQMICQFKDMPPPRVDRCDDEYAESNLRGVPYTFIAAHLPYGLHNRLSGSPMLMTVLRDPVQRVCSAYGYNCMRKNQKTDISGLAGFAADQKNTNLMTKLLSGNPETAEVSEWDLTSIIERLSKKFDFVSTTSDIPAICESFLKYFGLPNVLTTRINPTPNQFKPSINGLTQEIRDANKFDNVLFETFSGRGPILPAGDEKENTQMLHPLTVLLTECGDQNASQFWGTLIQTGRLFTEGLIDQQGAPDSDAIDSLIKEMR